MVTYDDAHALLEDARGCELALNIARFWKSRVTMLGANTTSNKEIKYSILGVMGPDEYHYNVNNSVFTNYNAKLSLKLPVELHRKDDKLCGYSTEEINEYQNIAQHMKNLFDEKLKFHPQFEGFKLSEPIKQSDVVLLGFPLMMKMSKEVRENDLLTYEKITDRFGPDTGTWSMHTVGWLELGQPQNAMANFQMMFRNFNGPFKVLSEKPAESPDGVRCVNFITLGGGILQAVMFGYGGMRIHSDELHVNPQMVPNATSWGMKGIKYKGFTFDVSVEVDKFSITLKQVNGTGYARLIAGERTDELKLNKKMQFPFGLVRIKKTDKPLSEKHSNVCATMFPSIWIWNITLYFLLMMFNFF